jgi:hypothetical protein
MRALLGAVAAALAMPAPAQAECAARLCYAASLTPFFERLRSGESVHILQIGDSHTAGDTITGPWRDRLQARHGAGGRGVLAAGRPYAGYRTRGVTATQSGGWRVRALFGRDWSDGPPLGLAGFTQTASAPGETLTLAADRPDQAFDRIIVCALAGPGAGTVRLRMGEADERWPLDAPEAAPACRTMDSDLPVAAASIATEDDGPVSITSFAGFRRRGGAVLSNLGVVGAQLDHLGRTSDAVVAAELAAYRPDLIVLAFGTNEAGRDGGADPAARRPGRRDPRRGAGAGVRRRLVGAAPARPRPGAAESGRARARPRFLGLVDGNGRPLFVGRLAARRRHARRPCPFHRERRRADRRDDRRRPFGIRLRCCSRPSPSRSSS